MSKKTSYTEEEKQLILKLYNEGHGSPYIAKELNNKYPVSTIHGFIRRSIPNPRGCRDAAKKFSCDEFYFNKIDTEDKAYWLGFIYADGYIMNNQYSRSLGIALAEKDKEHLEKFKKCIKSNHIVHTYIQKTGFSANNKYSKLVIISPQIFEDSEKQGCVENKTLILQPPDIPKDYYKDFIRGYFDGDGCVTYNNTQNNGYNYKITIVGTDAILTFIKEWIEENKIAKINKFFKRRPTDKVSNIDFGGNLQVKKFLDSIYNNATVYLDRKYKRYLDLCEIVNSRGTLKEVS